MGLILLIPLDISFIKMDLFCYSCKDFNKRRET